MNAVVYFCMVLFIFVVVAFALWANGVFMP